MKYISHRPKLSARRLHQKAEQEACERQNKEDRSIMDGLIAEEVQARAKIETKRKADKEARQEAKRREMRNAMEAAEARARVRAETIRAIPWLRSYSNGELDFELTRRRQWPPTSVEIGIGYWEETSVDQLLAELVATPVDEESLKLMKEWPELRIMRPFSWAVRAWREWELLLAIRQHEKDPNAIFRRVIEVMEWEDYFRTQILHSNNPAARH